MDLQDFDVTDFCEFEATSQDGDDTLTISLEEHLGFTSPPTPLKRVKIRQVNGITLKTDFRAKGNKGEEIPILMTVARENGATLNTYYQAVLADETHFSYNLNTQTITLPNDNGIAIISNDVDVVYAYVREKNNQTGGNKDDI